jgi:hypothetical protein
MIRKIRLIISSSSVITESKFLTLVSLSLSLSLSRVRACPHIHTHTHTHTPTGLTQDLLWKWTMCLAIFAKPLKIFLEINIFTILWQWKCMLKKHEYISSVLPLTKSFQRLELWMLVTNFQWHATSGKQMNVIGL